METSRPARENVTMTAITNTGLYPCAVIDRKAFLLKLSYILNEPPARSWRANDGRGHGVAAGARGHCRGHGNLSSEWADVAYLWGYVLGLGRRAASTLPEMSEQANLDAFIDKYLEALFQESATSADLKLPLFRR